MTMSDGIAGPDAWRLFGLTFAGCGALYMLCKCKGSNQVTFLKTCNVRIDERTHGVVIVIDLTLTSLIGAVLMYFLVGPATNAQAITAGLGFTGTLNALKKEDDGNGR